MQHLFKICNECRGIGVYVLLDLKSLVGGIFLLNSIRDTTFLQMFGEDATNPPFSK